MENLGFYRVRGKNTSNLRQQKMANSSINPYNTGVFNIGDNECLKN